MKICSKILPLLLSLLLQPACSTHQAVYIDESFAIDSHFKQKMNGEVTPVCESARRALLGQGYLIEIADREGVKARKAVKREDKPNTFIEMNIVCLPESTGSTVFATGLLSTYSLKKSSSSASVGVSALGSISLPIGQSADSLVKVSEDTIDDKDFYQRFFAAVSNILGELQAGMAPPVAAETAAPTITQSAAETTSVAIAKEGASFPAESEPIATGVIERAPVVTSTPVLVEDDVAATTQPETVEQWSTREPKQAPVVEAPMQPAPELVPESQAAPVAEPVSDVEPEPAPETTTETPLEPVSDAAPPDSPMQPEAPLSDPVEWHYDDE